MKYMENVKCTEVESDLSAEGVIEISASLRQLLADVFTPYIKTKSFHWRITGRQFREYHILLDEHADQIFATTDEIAERGRKISDATISPRGAQRLRSAQRRGHYKPNRSLDRSDRTPYVVSVGDPQRTVSRDK